LLLRCCTRVQRNPSSVKTLNLETHQSPMFLHILWMRKGISYFPKGFVLLLPFI
jgi:hypothetical protein